MDEIKAPNYLQTWTLFKRLGDLLTFGRMAQCCGKEVQTAEAWAREPASNENPNGSGRRNPVDCILRLMGKAHKEDDRELVREIADTFADYADYLDGMHSDAKLSVIQRAGIAAKEAGESVFEAVKGGDPHRIVKEATDAEIAFRDLKQTAYVQMRPTRRMAAEAVDTRRNGNGGAKHG